MTVKQRYVRHGDELSDDTVIVVRGGTLNDDDVLDDALASFEVYGVYALSVFALVGTDGWTTWQQCLTLPCGREPWSPR